MARIPKYLVSAKRLTTVIMVVFGMIYLHRPFVAEADAPSGRFTMGSIPDTVFDNVTELTWKKTPENGTFTWAAATSQCNDGWRLPTISELLSIVDRSKTDDNAIDLNFFVMPSSSNKYFWSITPNASSPTNAWDVNFDFGYSLYGGVGNGYYVRCVRG